MRSTLLCGVAIVIATTARADSVDDLVTAGEELGKQGAWTQAIAAFKAADAQRPSARNACLIGLAYLRRELWAEAELFLTTCRQRASAGDPLPDWIGDAEQQLRTKLAATDAAAVAIAVAPAAAHAWIRVSGFAPDESFAPRMIHLAPGRYSLVVAAPGYLPAERTLVVADASAQLVTIELASPGARNLVPLAIAGAGVALVAGGFAMDGLVVQPIRTDLEDARTIAYYDQRKAALAPARDAAIAMWSIGATAVVTAVVLRATVFSPRVPRVDAAVLRGGGAVSLEWSR